MLSEMDVFEKMNQITGTPQFSMIFAEDGEQARKIADHKEWLKRVRHERPNPEVPYKVAVYIRYFNQTKYDNYLDFHKKQFMDTLDLCPQWKFVDFYIDEGSSAPNMESAPAWRQLLEDCLDGKVDLIVTQKVSNVSKRIYEVTLCSRILAAQTPPIGIYFISEDIFTLSSYYMEDLKDVFFLPDPEWKILPDDECDIRGALDD